MSKTIEITTVQNVVIEYEPARLRERVLAFLLDGAILLAAYIILTITMTRLIGSNSFAYGVMLVVLPFLLFFAYYFFFEIGANGQTPGKMAMNTKVVRLDGKEPEWSDMALRSLLHLVDTLFSLGALGALLIKISDKNQRLGDMAANTTVIKIQGVSFRFTLRDIQKIHALDHTPTYPQVVQMHERDMICIKNALERYLRYPNDAHANAIEDLVTKVMPMLDISVRPADRMNFLRLLLRDYIVLTR